MKYEFLLFDADNTLLDFDLAEEEALKTACAESGIRYNEHVLAVYKKVNDKVWKEFEQGKMTSQELRTARFERLSMKKGFSSIKAEIMSFRYLKALSENAFLIPGALDVVKTLASSRTIGIITNGLKEVQEGRFANSPITEFLSFVVISDAIGCKKPEKAFFDYALKKAGNPALGDCLIIGDSLRSDIAGGIGVGIDTCWYSPAGTANRTNVFPTYTIQRLDELYGILAS